MALPKPDHCKTCLGYSWACPSAGSGFVRPQIAAAGRWNHVTLVFEAAGEYEANIGLPLQGPAGGQFEQMLQRGQLSRDTFDIANVLSCRPPNNYLVGASYEHAVIDHCAPYLDTLLADRRPRVLVAGGGVALRRVLPDCPVGIDDARGYVHWSDRYQCWVVPTIHPSRILRGQTALTAVFIHDITKAVEIARDGFEYLNTDFYVLDPTPDAAKAWVDRLELLVSCKRVAHLSSDIETPDKDANEDELEDEEEDEVKDRSFIITRCGYSYHDTLTGKANVLSMPWGGPYEALHRRLLEMKVDHLWWNKSFDVPRIIADGKMPGGVQHDGMESWHVLNSDLRRSLGHVSSFLNPRVRMWKHLSFDMPAFYNGQDAYTADVNQTKTVADLKKHGLWPVYVGQVLEMDPIWSSMSAAGMPVDPVRRLAFAKQLTELQDGVRAEMQAAVPDDCRRLEPKDGYKIALGPERLDSIRAKLEPGEKLVEWVFDAVVFPRCSQCGVDKPTKTHFKSKITKTCSVCGKKWTAKHTTRKGAGACAAATEQLNESNPCLGATIINHKEGTTRWVRLQPFVPSPKQILRYMEAKRYTLVYEGKGEQRRATTNIKALKKIRAAHPGDPLFPLIMDDRKLDKLAGTYIGRYVETPEGPKVRGGFPVGPDGRVHAQFTNAPSTLRTSMRAPNLQNLPR